MENNEVMYEEQDVIDVEENNDETRSGGGIAGKIIGGVILAGITAGAVALYKKKIAPMRKARAIKQLEKEGYVIHKPEDDQECMYEADFEDVTEE